MNKDAFRDIMIKHRDINKDPHLALMDEMAEAYRELLEDTMCYYPTFPNAFRKTAEEYYKADIDILTRYEEIKKEVEK
jgi:hypothetical protein